MILHNQISPHTVTPPRTGWIKPFVTSAVALGLFFAGGFGSTAKADVSPSNDNPAIIIDNQLQALGASGTNDQTDLDTRFSTASSAQILAALSAALQEFPAPNPDNVADNPGYATPTSYTPEDLTNYILDKASSTITQSNSFKAMAANVVKTAITTLQAVPFPNIATDKAIEHITAGAAVIVAERYNASALTAAQKDAGISTLVATLVTNSIKLDPSDANGIVDEIVAEFKTPVTATLSGSNDTTFALTPTTLTQLQATKLIAAVEKGVQLAQATTDTAHAVTTIGGAFFTSTSGTAGANQSFIAATLKALPTTIPGLGVQVVESGLAISGTATPVLGTHLSAAQYTAQIMQFAGAKFNATVVQGVATALLASSGTGTSLSAMAMDLASGGVIAKPNAAIDGAILGGIVAADPTEANTLLNASGLYGDITNVKALGTDPNRTLFVSTAITPLVALGTSGTGAIAKILTNTVLLDGSFNTGGKAATYLSLATAVATAAASSPTVESIIPALMISGGVHTAGFTVTDLAEALLKGAGLSGYASYSALLTASGATDATALTSAQTICGTSSIKDTVREQVIAGAIAHLSGTTGNTVNSTVQSLIHTAAASSAGTDAPRAAFVYAVMAPFLSSTATVNSVLTAAFSGTSAFFGSPALAATPIAKSLLSRNGTDDSDTVLLANAAATAALSSGATAVGGVANAIGAVVKASPSVLQAVVSAVSSTQLANDANLANFETFTTSVIGTSLKASVKLITESTASVYAMAHPGTADSSLIDYATAVITGLAGKNFDQVAGGVAQALQTGSDASTLANVVAFEENSSAANRGKIAAAIASTNPAQAAAVVSGLITGGAVSSGTFAGSLVAQGTLAERISISTGAAGVATAQAAAITTAVTTIIANTSVTPVPDIGSFTAAIVKAIPLPAATLTGTALATFNTTRAGYITDTVNAALSASVSGSSIGSNLANSEGFLIKAASASTFGGALIAQAVVTNIASAQGFSPSSDVAGFDSFFVAVALKAGVNTQYVAQGMASYLDSSNVVSFATNAAANALLIKQPVLKADLAAGAATAVPADAVSIAMGVGASIVTGTGETTKMITADDVARINIAAAVATVVAPSAPTNPSPLLDVVHDMAGTLKLVASYTTLANTVGTKILSKLPKSNQSMEIASVASEILLAAHQSSLTFAATDLAQIVQAMIKVKPTYAYQIVGAAVATVATFESGLALASFEAQVQVAQGTFKFAGLSGQAAKNAVNSYVHGNDTFDVGAVTRPETGVTNI